MSAAQLEHVNITAPDPAKTAAMLHEIFGWTTRWEGPAIAGGYTIHVGSGDSYIAIYSPGKATTTKTSSYGQTGGLNHVGVVVEDLDEIQQRVEALGLEAHSHADYEPGRRFYFHDADQLEWEVISYS